MFVKIKEFLFENRTARQTVAKNSFWLAVSNIGGRLLRALVIIYAARVLGAGPWGAYSYAITIVGFFTAFLDIGLNPIVMRETARGRSEDEVRATLSTAFVLKFTLMAAGVLIVLFAVPYAVKIEAAKPLLPIVALIFVFDTMREFGFAVFRSRERMEREAGLYLFTNLAIVAAGFTFLAKSPTAPAFAWAYAAGTAAGMIATFAAVRPYLAGILANFARERIIPILRSAWPFAVTGLLGVFLLNTDIFIIGFFKSADEVGYYAAANRVIQLLYIIPAVIATSALATFSRTTDDPGKLKGILERILTLNYAIAIPAAIGGAALGTNLMIHLFGASYAPGGTSFSLLALTLLANFPAAVMIHVAFAFDRQRILIRNGLLAGALNVALDLILIPRYGIAGSAFGTLVTQIASNIYLWHQIRKFVPFAVLPHLPRIALSATLMGGLCAALAALGVNVFVIVGAGVFFYAAALYASREPIIREIKTAILPPPA